MKKHKVVIVGGGFGGIKVALELADSERFAVTLISNQPNFQFYPTLYRTATGGKQDNSTIPIKNLLNDKPVKFVQDEATSLDRKSRVLSLKSGKFVEYDTIVLGLGVVTNYFGIPGMAEHSFSIKSNEEIKRFKEHIHKQLSQDHRPELNFIVVGGGPTGIELAGALPGYIREIMQKHGIKKQSVHVDLVEAAPRLLPRMPKDASRMITRRLRNLGVRVRTGQRVEALSAEDLTVNGKPIRSHTVVWTAGVTNHPFFKDNGFTIMPRGKVATNMYLQTDENVFVIGDNADTPYSGMAQTALADGIYVANTIKRLASGQDPKSYKVKKPVTVIPVGDRWAAVIWGKVRMYGVVGWMLRESADIAAFNEYQPWWQASQQWLTSFGEEESCDICLASEEALSYSGY